MNLKMTICRNGYSITNIVNNNRYIVDAIHVEADRELIPPYYDNDRDAQRAAESEGLSLIYGMEDVPDGVYVDTPNNREVIRQMLLYFPGYRFLHQYRARHPGS